MYWPLPLSLLTTSQIVSKTARDPIEQQSNPARRLKIFVHGYPDLQLELNGLCQDRHEFRRPLGDVVLAAADPNPGAQCCQLCRVAVASKAKGFARDLRQWTDGTESPVIAV